MKKRKCYADVQKNVSMLEEIRPDEMTDMERCVRVWGVFPMNQFDYPRPSVGHFFSVLVEKVEHPFPILWEFMRVFNDFLRRETIYWRDYAVFFSQDTLYEESCKKLGGILKAYLGVYYDREKVLQSIREVWVHEAFFPGDLEQF